MIRLIWFVLAVLASLFKSKIRLEAENAALRHQLIVLRRNLRGRVRLTNHDRWFFVQLYRWFPSILTVLTIIRPATLVRWHRAGFRCYWRWKSRSFGDRPPINADPRQADCARPMVGTTNRSMAAMRGARRSRCRFFLRLALDVHHRRRAGSDRARVAAFLPRVTALARMQRPLARGRRG